MVSQPLAPPFEGPQRVESGRLRRVLACKHLVPGQAGEVIERASFSRRVKGRGFPIPAAPRSSDGHHFAQF
jgi:hypothetical protein